MAKENGYYYQKIWFDFAFENPDLISPGHTAMYLWFVELNNRMGWSEKFASPASQTMAAIGLKSYNTYKKIFTELVELEFISLITESKNQYTACIIALSKFDKALDMALDETCIMPYQNLTKHCIGTVQSNDSIIKEVSNNIINVDFEIFWNLYGKKKGDRNACTKKWHKLSDKTREKIIEVLPIWKDQFSDIQYQPFPMTFLNQERWNDEITVTKTIVNGKHAIDQSQNQNLY